MTVLVVRPEPACTELVQMLNQAGISAIAAPLLSFGEGKELSLLVDKFAALPPNSIVIAVSPRAIEFAHQVLKKQFLREDLHYVAIGKTTAELWKKLSAIDAIIPNNENSEGLLSLKIFFKPESRNILILRGNGGREFLANELKQLGAKVCYFETYQRIWNSENAIAQSKLWIENKVETLIVTSGEQLELLWNSLNQAMQFWLIQCQLFVPSQRVYHQAKSLGFKTVINVNSANNMALFDALNKTKLLDNTNDREKQNPS